MRLFAMFLLPGCVAMSTSGRVASTFDGDRVGLAAAAEAGVGSGGHGERAVEEVLELGVRVGASSAFVPRLGVDFSYHPMEASWRRPAVRAGLRVGAAIAGSADDDVSFEGGAVVRLSPFQRRTTHRDDASDDKWAIGPKLGDSSTFRHVGLVLGGDVTDRGGFLVSIGVEIGLSSVPGIARRREHRETREVASPPPLPPPPRPPAPDLDTAVLDASAASVVTASVLELNTFDAVTVTPGSTTTIAATSGPRTIDVTIEPDSRETSTITVTDRGGVAANLVAATRARLTHLPPRARLVVAVSADDEGAMAASATGHPCRLGSSGGTHTFDVASPNAPRGLAIIGHVVTRVELGGRTRLVALEPNLGLGTRCGGEQPTDLFGASIELIDGTSEFPTLLSTVEGRVAALGAARLRSRGAELSRRLRAQLAATGPRPTDDQISTEDRNTVEVRWIADRRVVRFAFIREVEQRVQLRDKTGPVATQGPSWTVRSITLVDVNRRGDLAATDLPIVVERRSGK